MRLVSFDKSGKATLGVRAGNGIVDLSVAAPDLPTTWPEVFAKGQLNKVKAAAEAAPADAMHAADSVTILVPIAKPPKILCIGLNYVSHAQETNNPIPDYPVVFPRWPTSVVAHEAPMVAPKETEQFDFECELAIVIGTGGRHIPRDTALQHVAGYACFNDGSLRDYQFKSSQWAMGKNFDNSGSWGPDIVTADELPAGCKGLKIGTRLNGETVQGSDIDDMIFPIDEIISTLSEVMTLEPGDVIPTGTPPGVGVGRKPPLWMKAGDTVEVEIEKIGVLRNKIVAA